MSGFFGVVSTTDCINDLYYGTDYHSHLGTRRGGLAVAKNGQINRIIHNIESTQFRSKFDQEVGQLTGNMGIGCISNNEDQPLIIGSHLGRYAVVSINRINNQAELVRSAFGKRTTHFSEMSEGEINPTELVATLINHGSTYEEGIRIAQQAVEGTCSMLILTGEGLYAVRDRFGRIPLVIGRKDGSYCATFETCAFPNLGYEFEYELGPGEAVFISPKGIEKRIPASNTLRICGFLWIYYGYPASNYEGLNVEIVRNRCGRELARNDISDGVRVDMVAGVPDSGISHALGYANEAKLPFLRPFVKYTPTWPRSFMPQNQDVRNLVARMKLIPIRELIDGRRLLFCEDSIVRGTQLRETIQRLYDCGAKEVHMRPACPPLIYLCKYLNFSRSRSELDLAGRHAIHELESGKTVSLEPYADFRTDRYRSMIERIRDRLSLTTLKYQTIPGMISAIGLPKEKVCTYCWDGMG
jgi:amidophosphoribosyltransferase